MQIVSKKPKQRRASALAIILAVIVLITVIAVTFLTVARFERTATSLALGRVQAESLADFAVDTAIVKMREAIAAGTYIAGTNTKTWASMPGRIAVFDLSATRYSGTNNVTYYDIFSGTAGPDAGTPDLNNVDLNKMSALGEYPIATPTGTSATASGSAVGPYMKIGWINLLADSGTTASSSNPIVGRIAYWMDDETCKVNINTADGSHKTDLNPDGGVADGSVSGYPAISATGPVNSYGFGTPSEISLAALPLSSSTIASAIATYASGTNSSAAAYASGTSAPPVTGFNSAAEVGRASGVPSGFYVTNKFNITHTSRSPDLNMFGEPRIMLFPTLLTGTYSEATGNVTSGTLRRAEVLGPSGGFYTGASGTTAFRITSGTSMTDSGATVVPSVISAPINFVYPLSKQLPLSSGSVLAQYPGANITGANGFYTSVSAPAWGNYRLGMRIANYLNGSNSQGQSITWPDYGTGVKGSTAFNSKYNLRQIDCITLQILDMVSQSTMCDQSRSYNYPTIMVSGFLSGTLIPGFGRTAKLTEIYMSFALAYDGTQASGTSTPSIAVNSGALQFYFPKYFSGAPLSGPYYTDSINIGNRGGNQTTTLSYPDTPLLYSGTTAPPVANVPIATGSLTGGVSRYWSDSLMYFADSSGADVGVDLTGNSKYMPDPDQSSAAIYHPWDNTGTASSTSGTYYQASGTLAAPVVLSGTPPYYTGVLDTGTGHAQAVTPMLYFFGPKQASVASWYQGEYQACPTVHASGTSPGPLRYGKPATTISSLKGGVSLWTFGSSNSVNENSEFTPLESFLAPPWGSVGAANTAMVIPMSNAGSFPGGRGGNFNVTVWASDPLVNKFPGDWKSKTAGGNSNTADAPNKYMSGTAASYGNNISISGTLPFPSGTLAPPDQNTNGDVPGFSGTSTGDPLSVWAPAQDLRMPKLARFPSVGALNSIRTGIIPDGSGTAGTPWRSISFAASSDTGQTANGISYPDWVMMDLFTVPFVPQPPATVFSAGIFTSGTFGSNGTILAAGGVVSGNTGTLINTGSGVLISTGTGIPQPPPRLLTYGGATEGRLNINNPLTPYPFSSGTWPSPQRTAPLQALFYGIQASTSYSSGSGNPVWSTVDSGSANYPVTTAVQNYLTSNGPFMLPGELANVTAISNYTYTGVASNAHSRNDLMRQVIGAATTQSNTYSIWVVSQTVKKNPNNSKYGTYETGDTVTGEVRRRYLVERYIDPGTDGVPGNAASPGVPGFIGTEGDAVDGDLTASPPVAGANPKMSYPLPYRWRILSVEDVTR